MSMDCTSNHRHNIRRTDDSPGLTAVLQLFQSERALYDEAYRKALASAAITEATADELDDLAKCTLMSVLYDLLFQEPAVAAHLSALEKTLQSTLSDGGRSGSTTKTSGIIPYALHVTRPLGADLFVLTLQEHTAALRDVVGNQATQIAQLESALSEREDLASQSVHKSRHDSGGKKSGDNVIVFDADSNIQNRLAQSQARKREQEEQIQALRNQISSKAADVDPRVLAEVERLKKQLELSEQLGADLRRRLEEEEEARRRALEQDELSFQSFKWCSLCDKKCLRSAFASHECRTASLTASIARSKSSPGVSESEAEEAARRAAESRVHAMSATVWFVQLRPVALSCYFSEYYYAESPPTVQSTRHLVHVP
jgi:hypothetical protein